MRKKCEMSDAQPSSIKPKIPRFEDRESILQPKQYAVAPVQAPNFSLSEMDLFPLDHEDDDALIEFLNKNPNFVNDFAIKKKRQTTKHLFQVY